MAMYEIATDIIQLTAAVLLGGVSLACFRFAVWLLLNGKRLEREAALAKRLRTGGGF